MLAPVPKQYLRVQDRFIADISFATILSWPRLAGLVVAVAENDPLFDSLEHANHPQLHRVQGGATRADSVRSGLQYLIDHADENDWVLVHDAARPGLRHADIDRLVDGIRAGDDGAILAMPAVDTIKHTESSDAALVAKTIPREHVWLAQTPQMTRVGLLAECFQHLDSRDLDITDDASLLELCDYQVRCIIGAASNFKVTKPEDLALIDFYLQQADD